jgi:hypothetical protein
VEVKVLDLRSPKRFVLFKDFLARKHNTSIVDALPTGPALLVFFAFCCSSGNKFLVEKPFHWAAVLLYHFKSRVMRLWCIVITGGLLLIPEIQWLSQRLACECVFKEALKIRI